MKLDSVEKSAEKDLVVKETSSASSEMVRKVKNKAEYTAGLQAYTVQTLNKTVPNSKDIDQYKLVHVEDYPLKSNQMNLDLMLYPNLFPTGEFGEHHLRLITLRNAEYVKSRLMNKDSRYRKRPRPHVIMFQRYPFSYSSPTNQIFTYRPAMAIVFKFP